MALSAPDGFTIVRPDLLCITVYDDPVISYPLYEVSPKAGSSITDIVTNAEGGFRLTVADATNYAGMRSVKNCTDNGSGLCRIEVYSTTGMSNGNTVYVNNVGGVPAANGTWTVSNVTATTFDLVGTTFSGAFTAGGFAALNSTTIWGRMGGHNVQSYLRLHIRGVNGDLGDQLNDQVWFGALWSATEIDIVTGFPNSTLFGSTKSFNILGTYEKLHAYTGGGTISEYYSAVTTTHPYTGASGAMGIHLGRDNNYQKFNGPAASTYTRLNRANADNPASYPTIGGRTVTAVYRTSQPWNSSTLHTSASKIMQFRHRLFLELDGDIAQGTYSVDMSGIGLGTIPFVWNDKTTRCYSLATSQVGFRPGDPYKKAFLRAWVPGYGANDGAIDFSDFIGANAGHLIDGDGNIVDSFDINLRVAYNEVEPGQVGWSTIDTGMSSSVPVITNVTDNGSGLIRITTAADDDKFRLQTGVVVIIYGVVGTGGLDAAANGRWTITRISNTQFDLQGSSFVGAYTSGGRFTCMFPYTSTTDSIPIDDIDHTVVPCRITSVGHGLVTGQKIRPHDIGINVAGSARGPAGAGQTVSALERGASGTGINVGNVLSYYIVNVVDADTIELLTTQGANVDVSACTVAYTPGSGGRIHMINQSNAAGTNVYDCDFAAFSTEGEYRFYIEGLGVSDPFRIDEKVWADIAQFHIAAEYHQRAGLRKDGRFGTSYPTGTYRDGDGTNRVYKSLLPGDFTPQGSGPTGGGHTSTPYITTSAAAYPPWFTWDRATGINGGHMDAADTDVYLNQHSHIYMYWAQVCDLIPSVMEIDWKLPTLSSTLGGIWTSATDDIKGLLNSAIWGVHMYLANADADGMTHGGIIGSFEPRNSDPGQQAYDISPTQGARQVLLAGSHGTNYQASAIASVIARCLRTMGHTTQAEWYEEKALLLFNWAETIFLDDALAAGPRDDYYRGYCNLTNAVTGWDDATYADINLRLDSMIAGAVKTGGTAGRNQGWRAAAAAALFRKTGDTAYETIWYNSYPNQLGMVGFVGPAWWEMYKAVPTPSSLAESRLNANRVHFTNLWNAHYGYNAGYSPDTVPIPKGGRPAYDHLTAGGEVSSASFGGACTVIHDTVWGLIHYRHLIHDETGIWEDEPLRLLQGGMQYLNGANSVDFTLITGMGQRWIHGQLHNDRQAYGDGYVPKGTPVYWYNNFGTPAATSLNLSNGGLVQTVLVPDSNNPDDLNKTITPTPRAWPVHDMCYTASLFIGAMEFTIGGPIEANLMASAYLASYDGNTENPTQPTLRVYHDAVD
jgi:hypothetical protein